MKGGGRVCIESFCDSNIVENVRVTMTKVFCIGLGKTGTTTFGQALTLLGYHHCAYREDLVRAYEAKDWEILKSVTQEYQSFDDFPWPLVYEWLDRMGL